MFCSHLARRPRGRGMSARVACDVDGTTAKLISSALCWLSAFSICSLALSLALSSTFTRVDLCSPVSQLRSPPAGRAAGGEPGGLRLRAERGGDDSDQRDGQEQTVQRPGHVHAVHEQLLPDTPVINTCRLRASITDPLMHILLSCPTKTLWGRGPRPHHQIIGDALS